MGILDSRHHQSQAPPQSRIDWGWGIHGSLGKERQGKKGKEKKPSLCRSEQEPLAHARWPYGSSVDGAAWRRLGKLFRLCPQDWGAMEGYKWGSSIIRFMCSREHPGRRHSCLSPHHSVSGFLTQSWSANQPLASLKCWQTLAAGHTPDLPGKLGMWDSKRPTPRVAVTSLFST